MAAVPSSATNSLPVSTSPFDQALTKFKSELSDKEIEDFQLATVDDLKHAVLQLQKKQASEKRMQNLNRLTAFVEAMEQFDKVIQVFLNACDYIAFVWGPAKFMLVVAASHGNALNTLLEAYQEIGEHMPLLPQYESLTLSGPYLHQILAFFYTDILEFHRKAIKHFRQPAWKQLFHATWNTFRANFNGILSNLRFHRDILNSQAILVGVHEIDRAIEELREFRRDVEANWRRTQDEEAERRMRAIAKWLAVDDTTVDHEDALAVVEGRLFQQDLVKNWLDPQSLAKSLLWINGKPGAGKTILASLLIERCRLVPNAAVAYFYCKHGRPDRDNFLAMSCSLILQLSYQRPSLQAFIMDEMSTEGAADKLKSLKAAKKVLNMALASVDKLFLVIDGIDECLKTQKGEISSWARSAFSNPTSSPSKNLRCCFLSQDDNDTGKLFKSLPSVKITAKHNSEEISHYCHLQAESIGATFGLLPNSIQGLAETVCETADGMFLYAKLVMENLSAQVSKAALKKEMGKIPPTLNKIYGRIIHRIFEESRLPDQQVAKTLLSWLLCAKRPLKWHEIQGAMCLDLDDRSFDPDRRLVRDLKHFCGSLVEVRQGGTISFVHLTAQIFLQDHTVLPRQLEQFNLTRICFSQLTLESHDPDNTEDSIREFVRRGEYAFTEYAIVHAFGHLQDTCLQVNTVSDSDYFDLCAILRKFVTKRVHVPAKRAAVAKSIDDSLAVFKDELFFRDLRHAAAYTHRYIERTSCTDNNHEPVITLNTHMAQVRNVIEKMITVSGLSHDLECLYGRDIFKCSETYCQSFHMGFSTKKARDTHGKTHERTWLCPFSGCPLSISGLGSAAELEQHRENHRLDPHDDTNFPWDGTLASLNIDKEIKNGNDLAFDLWLSQWEGDVPSTESQSWFNISGLLDVARQARRHNMLEKMFDKIDWTSLTRHRVRQFLIRTLHFQDEQTAARILRVFKKFTELDIYHLFSMSLKQGLELTAAELLSYHASALSDPANTRRHLSYLNRTIQSGRLETFRKLLTEYGLDPELQDGKGNTPMVLMGELDRTDMARYLVEKLDCDKWATNANGDTALTIAGRQGHEDFILSLFREEQREPNVRLWLRTAQFRNAVCNGDDQKVMKLLDKADLHVDELDSKGYSPWLWAVRKGHRRVVEIFLQRPETSGVSFLRSYPDNLYYASNVLQYAVCAGYESIVQSLLQSSKFDSELYQEGAAFGINLHGTPLQLAVSFKEKGIIKIIEDYASNLEVQKPTTTESPAPQASTPDSEDQSATETEVPSPSPSPPPPP